MPDLAGLHECDVLENLEHGMDGFFDHPRFEQVTRMGFETSFFREKVI